MILDECLENDRMTSLFFQVQPVSGPVTLAAPPIPDSGVCSASNSVHAADTLSPPTALDVLAQQHLQTVRERERKIERERERWIEGERE